MRHVGDRHDQAVAVPVRLGEHGVIEVARVLAVDGDQRDGPQILAGSERYVPCGLRLVQRLLGEGVRDVVRVDAHQADGAGVPHAAEPLRHTRADFRP